ncbi:DUF4192 family protein [Bifidobacterium sp. W8115]|uniref:Uncharacterized protein n=1 Tax=Bifidobacterium asteroides TaxID=1684 RepID=A0A0F4KZN5_9BIFI|nr:MULTISPECIES: DUF4192 family protein [Bifidobacterium]KJY51433.1 hypothetical protein JF69_07100 [Bifidobacterium asteroides]MBI0072206.1 DUF4192 family protein [Bifidobacterium sp. W8112]MBI0125381.1 DUF4192 family protein [Bifidobacterium apousia]
MNTPNNDTSSQAIRIWLRALEKDTELTGSECDTILGAITTSMPCRDTFVLASTGFHGSTETLEHMAVDNPSRDSVDLFSRSAMDLLTGEAQPDVPVLTKACRLLTQLEERAEGGQAAQPYAIHSWLAWLVGDFHAAQMAALLALAEDENVTLAHTVLTGIRLGVHIKRAKTI